MALEFAAGSAPTGPSASSPYPIRVTGGENGAWVLDWGPTVEALLSDRSDPARAARRFHLTLAVGIVELARRAGERRVALTGGCFQNQLLTELTLDRLNEAGFEPVWHARLPPNDGGIAIGQVMAAARVKTRPRLSSLPPHERRTE